MSREILITGGAGFIGRNMCRRFLDEGEHVTCLDNFYTGDRDHIRPFFGDSNFRLLERDVTAEIPADRAYDEIYHLACPASPPRYQADPLYTWEIAVLGTLNALNLAKTVGARMVNASTSEVYGDPLIHPQTESYAGNCNLLGPRACYDEGKRAAEIPCYEYWSKYGVDVRVARIFNTYGPYMSADDGRVVSNFIVQALLGEDLTVYGDGSQTRSFCYIDDMVEGLICLMRTNRLNIDGPFNLGNPGEFTVYKLAEIILSKIETPSSIVYKPLPQDDPIQRCSDSGKALRKLGWKAKVPLVEGLDKTIEHFSKKLQSIASHIPCTLDAGREVLWKN